MTIQELKAEAKKHGYKLVKQKIPIPPDYKRNRKQEFIDFLLVFATCLGATIAFYFFILL